MSGMTRQPKLIKGAIIGLDPFNPVASIIIFQYNPNEVTRSLTSKLGSGGTDTGRGEATRLTGTPEETISVKLHLNAADQLEVGDSIAVGNGILPQIAALEMLITPKTLQLVVNTALALTGTLEIIPSEAPLTLFVWGTKRVVPVAVNTLNIREMLFDPDLNPIVAEVDVSMKVLTYNDLPILHPGTAISVANQVVKEALAVIGSLANAGVDFG